MSRRPVAVASTARTPRAGARTRAERRNRSSRLRSFLRSAWTSGRLPAFLLSVGLSVFLIGFLFSDDFTVHTVVVEGNKVAYADSIVARSEALGAQLFRLNTADVARRVAAHPAVAAAEVSARFPDRVVVRLTERVPVINWQVGDRSALIDQYGWVIAEGADPSLPRIFQARGVLPAPGERIPAESVQAGRYLHQQLGPRLSVLEFQEGIGLVAQLNDARSVVIGDADRMQLKMSVLESALALSTRWNRLDIREPDRPYYQ